MFNSCRRQSTTMKSYSATKHIIDTIKVFDENCSLLIFESDAELISYIGNTHGLLHSDNGTNFKAFLSGLLQGQSEILPALQILVHKNIQNVLKFLQDDQTVFSRPILKLACHFFSINMVVYHIATKGYAIECLGDQKCRKISVAEMNNVFYVGQQRSLSPQENGIFINLKKFSKHSKKSSKMPLSFSNLPDFINDLQLPLAQSRTTLNRHNIFENDDDICGDAHPDKKAACTPGKENLEDASKAKNPRITCKEQKLKCSKSQSKDSIEVINSLTTLKFDKEWNNRNLNSVTNELDDFKASELTFVAKPLWLKENRSPCTESMINSLDDHKSGFEKALEFIESYHLQYMQNPLFCAYRKKYKPVVFTKTEVLSSGKLKFYNEEDKFGFILLDNDIEIFLHKDDLSRSKINTPAFENCSKYFDILMKFNILSYQGKLYAKTKAVDIQILNFVPKKSVVGF